MRSPIVVVALLAACGSTSTTPATPAPAPQTPAQRAARELGPHTSVTEATVTLPGAHIFFGRPDPAPPDYDGFSAILLPDGGPVLRGPAAVRWAWNQGVREPAPLAAVAAIFVGHAFEVAGDQQKQATYISGREAIEPPAIANNQLAFYVVRGNMAPEAARVVVDLTTFDVAK